MELQIFVFDTMPCRTLGGGLALGDFVRESLRGCLLEVGVTKDVNCATPAGVAIGSGSVSGPLCLADGYICRDRDFPPSPATLL